MTDPWYGIFIFVQIRQISKFKKTRLLILKISWNRWSSWFYSDFKMFLTHCAAVYFCWNDCIYAFLLSWQLVTAGNAFKVTLAQNCMRDLGKKELRFLFFSISKGYSQKGNLNSKRFFSKLFVDDIIRVRGCSGTYCY